MINKYSIALMIVITCVSVMFASGIKLIIKKITAIEKQLQQVTITEKSRYIVSINPKDNWIMVNLDPNDFEIKEKNNEK